MGELDGRTALVTGGNRGIGEAIAVALARAGAAVAINYRQRGEDAERVRRLIAEAGGRAAVFQADVSRSQEVARLVSATEASLGPIGILVNNAGIARRQPLAEITEQDWDEILRVNLTSCFLMTQAVVPGMRARHWGRIINISSVAAQTGGVVGPHYAASKAGMLGLTRSYASLLAREGVTANAIAPALIETEMVTANPAARPELIPVGRFGAVEEVASTAVMLAANGYITGQTINVNGGWYMS
jgi:3-oxoacyl-[acyl-carrier protein] reductase